MDICIYQIDHELDENRVKFENLESTVRHQRQAHIDFSIYKKVFEGSVNCVDLEAVFTMFNTTHPTNYKGHSLSVSDIVEVKGDYLNLVGKIRFYNDSDSFEEVDYFNAEKFKEDIKEARYVGRTIEVFDLQDRTVPSVETGFYFCDSLGFKKVEFTPPEEAQDTMKVVVVKPNKKAEIIEIDSSLESLQAIVGGHIEALYPYNEEVAIVCNEEGKLEQLPLNRAIYSDDNEMIDILAGNFFICGLGEDDFKSLSEEQLKRYQIRFQYPERFIKINDEIKAVPFKPMKDYGR
ncbi:DUF3846 domain-containing protein [Paludicola sp. MB14-C6]|uniref:DUF3846 domain-containing protein n=1 Tax=Paludihabitans sp. MB14-C6 TaxID=3070656 RepID=UPI0027DE8A0A|nr:DUF3846 domain-containing protein [Paludicola sp. MB14-C6]WMJ22888.1 DUF3846 domain-containing protein [Paludicola sp. MB14-C6]